MLTSGKRVCLSLMASNLGPGPHSQDCSSVLSPSRLSSSSSLELFLCANVCRERTVYVSVWWSHWPQLQLWELRLKRCIFRPHHQLCVQFLVVQLTVPVMPVCVREVLLIRTARSIYVWVLSTHIYSLKEIASGLINLVAVIVSRRSRDMFHSIFFLLPLSRMDGTNIQFSNLCRSCDFRFLRNCQDVV